jgi:hypothetical protein
MGQQYSVGDTGGLELSNIGDKPVWLRDDDRTIVVELAESVWLEVSERV